MICYTVSIRMPGDINPFWLPRKAERILEEGRTMITNNLQSAVACRREAKALW
jgi:hypothetical protein